MGSLNRKPETWDLNPSPEAQEAQSKWCKEMGENQKLLQNQTSQYLQRIRAGTYREPKSQHESIIYKLERQKISYECIH
jgi:hypothetical protein